MKRYMMTERERKRHDENAKIQSLLLGEDLSEEERLAIGISFKSIYDKVTKTSHTELPAENDLGAGLISVGVNPINEFGEHKSVGEILDERSNLSWQMWEQENKQ